MRQLVERSSLRDKQAIGIQTDMKMSGITDMIDHYEAIKGTVRSNDSHQNVLVQ